MPERIQMSRQRPWRAEHPDAVIVARPGPLGNPFKIAKADVGWTITYPDGRNYGHFWGKREAAEHAVKLFRERTAPTLDLTWLAGRDLACWCPPDQPCHADVLLELANPKETP